MMKYPCGKCKKDCRKNCVQCDGCNIWFHQQCTAIPPSLMTHLGEVKGLFWKCDECLETNPIECLKTSLDKELQALKSSVKEINDNIPKIIKNTLEEETLKNTFSDQIKSNIENVMDEGIKSYRAALASESKPTESASKPSRSSDSEIQFIVTGVPEKGESHYERINSDVTAVEKIVSFIGVSPSGNITSLRRLGRSLPKGSNERRKCRPIIVTSSNPLFMETCFARSHKLQNYHDPVYIKKLLSPEDRALEKKILAKRYDMITNQGKVKSKFKITILQLFYQANMVKVENS